MKSTAPSALAGMDAGEAAAAPAAHTAELQAVKLRAVKKIRGLEDKLKALSEELEAARQHANEPGRRQGAELSLIHI